LRTLEADIGHRAIAWFLLIGFQLIAAFMSAAGGGALVAGVVSSTFEVSPDFAWVTSLSRFGLALAAVFIPAAAGAHIVLPARNAILRDIRGEPDPSLPTPLVVVLWALCGAAVLEVPALLTWWTTDRSVLDLVIPSGPDPLGWNMVPTAMLFSLPAMAIAALVTCVLTSLLTLTAPAKLSPRVLASGIFLQAGLIVGGILLTREGRLLSSGVFASMPVADVTATVRAVQDALERHDAAAVSVHVRLVWTCCGYLAALGVLFFSAPSRADGAIDAPVAPGEPATTAATAPFVPSVPSKAGVVFDDTNYSVSPRMTKLESLFIRKHTNYEIQTIPPRSRSRFSFSWTTGVLRQEPSGPALLAVTPARAPGLFTSHPYAVADAVTGEPLASLVPRGADWEIVHPAGAHIARVLQAQAGRGFARYTAMIGEREVCVFRWALNGLTVVSAELEIEFSRDDTSFDRALAVAIAPVLEQQARMISERARST
jgi:hypothetical protein